ncbi:MAG: FHA domain-containing protein, partial [Terriglobia bacterium]
MKLILEVRSGPQSGKKIDVLAGQLVRIGRTARADVAFLDDSHMSGVHFAIQCEEKVCWVRDYKSTNGTLVNGQKIVEVALRGGDKITAG